jgi:hypothetical protein
MDPKFEVFGKIHINAFIYSLLCWSYHDLSSQRDCDMTIKAEYRWIVTWQDRSAEAKQVQEFFAWGNWQVQSNVASERTEK